MAQNNTYDIGWWKEDHFKALDVDGDGLLNLIEFNDFLHPPDTNNQRLLQWLCTEETRPTSRVLLHVSIICSEEWGKRTKMTVEESKEADISTGKETHRISRGIHDKPLLIQVRLFYNGCAVKGTLLFNKKS